MKNDVISAFPDRRIPVKRPSKETQNHAGLVYLASGIDPYVDTKNTYIEAYRSLGIDILNRVPESNVVKTLKTGERLPCGNGYKRAYIGLFDTYFRERYPYTDVDEFFAAEDFELDYHDLITPVPHKLEGNTIRRKMDIAGEVGLYYYMLYTTLFMGGVEYLGWEVFMMAATLEPELFIQKILRRAFEKSKGYIAELAEVDIPYVFVHDDLADKSGPVFSPDWYDTYIFPRYPELWRPVKEKGKKVIFTADGIVICGMDTYLLTFGTPEEITREVDLISRKTEGMAGFALCSPGGLHNNIPIENLEAYFDARVRAGFTPEGWKKGNREYAKRLVRD